MYKKNTYIGHVSFFNSKQSLPVEVILLYQNITQLFHVQLPTAADVERLGHREIPDEHLRIRCTKI